MSRGAGSVRVDRTGTRATVIWDRPPLNVFDLALVEDLADALRSEPVRTAHVVVAKGDRHRWSAGLAVEDHLSGRVRPMLRAFGELLRTLRDVPGPVLAEVEGPCLGGGLELLGACDLAFAGASATFAQPEVRLGVFPPFAAAVDGRSLGPKRTAELLFLGDTIGAARAEAFGLINRTVADDMIEDEVNRTTEQLEGFRRETLVLLKKALRESEGPPWPLLDQAERTYLEELMALPDAEEGLRAFLEKRAPVWPARGP